MAKTNKPARTAVPPAVVTTKATIGGKTYAKKAVTLPFLLIQDGTTVRLRIDGPMHLGKEQPVKEGAKKMDEPMTLALVTALESVAGKKPITEGRQYYLICNKVISSNFTEHYPDNSYITKAFEITNNGKAEGKRHKDFEISELIEETA